MPSEGEGFSEQRGQRKQSNRMEVAVWRTNGFLSDPMNFTFGNHVFHFGWETPVCSCVATKQRWYLKRLPQRGEGQQIPLRCHSKSWWMTWKGKVSWRSRWHHTRWHDLPLWCVERKRTGKVVKLNCFVCCIFGPCRYEIEHEAYSIFRPNPVQVKSAKFTNLAGLVGYKPLANSSWIQLVWRCSVGFRSCLIMWVRCCFTNNLKNLESGCISKVFVTSPVRKHSAQQSHCGSSKKDLWWSQTWCTKWCKGPVPAPGGKREADADGCPSALWDSLYIYIILIYIYILRTDGKCALAPFKPLVQHEARALKLLFTWLGTWAKSIWHVPV